MLSQKLYISFNPSWFDRTAIGYDFYGFV